MQIQGSNAIMVGGASGICRATAERFVERGGKVAILDLERSDGANVARSLGGTFHPCNVMDFDGIEAVIAEAVALAKRFSTDNSGRFVNGVLASIATEVRPGAAPTGT